MTLSLVLFDTDRIKDYVFSTDRLTEFRGASARLEELNTLKTKAAILAECPTADVVYCNGGSALACVPTADVERVITVVEALYRREAITATISGASLPYEPDQPFGDQAREVAVELRRVKAVKPRENHVMVAPWLHVCDACAQYPASRVDGNQLICPACQLKREKGGLQRNIFWQGAGPIDQRGFLRAARLVGDTRWRSNQLPHDLDEISAVSSPPGYVGFLYADGNGMGKVLETLQTRNHYAQFADQVDTLTRDVVHHALQRHAQPRSVGGRREVAPFEILLMGGDDLMLVTAADLAVTVAQDIVKEYESRAPHETGHNLTLSLGLVFAHAHFPIYAMHDLAGDLLKSAKKVGGSALDFAVVTAAGSRDLKWLREEVLTERSFVRLQEGWHHRLTQRPYRLESFERLCYHARQLQAVRFPRSQLHALYEGVLFTSGVEASLQTITVIGRASPKHREKLLDFFSDFGSQPPTAPPWRLEKPEGSPKPYSQLQAQYLSTALGDLVELYRLVPALERGGGDAGND
ncbi:MAG: hypothetical protein M5U01_41900 [Ardenticatenaceae bacterium]|nr:hypothetical protein [Ardenticatenaceae bacterium]